MKLCIFYLALVSTLVLTFVKHEKIINTHTRHTHTHTQTRTRAHAHTRTRAHAHTHTHTHTHIHIPSIIGVSFTDRVADKNKYILFTSIVFIVFIISSTFTTYMYVQLDLRSASVSLVTRAGMESRETVSVMTADTMGPFTAV